MNNLKTFESFFSKEDKVNEGLMDFIKKLPFYEEAYEVYVKLKDKILEYLEKLPQEDLDKIRSFSPSYNENYELTLEKKSDLVKKVLSIFGLSVSAIGLLSGLTSMIVAEVTKSGTEATPWFIACVILLAVGGTSHFFSNDFDEDKKKPKRERPLPPPVKSRSRDPYMRRR